MAHELSTDTRHERRRGSVALRGPLFAALLGAASTACFGPLELENRLCPCPENYICGEDGRCHHRSTFLSTYQDTSDDSTREPTVAELVARLQRTEEDAYEEPDGSVLSSHGWISLYAPDTWGLVQFHVPEV